MLAWFDVKETNMFRTMEEALAVKVMISRSEEEYGREVKEGNQELHIWFGRFCDATWKISNCCKLHKCMLMNKLLVQTSAVQHDL